MSLEDENHKWVYTYGAGKAEGDRTMRNLLGGKGVGLHDMCSIGVPVPPGFTITTEVCTYYYDHNKQYPKRLQSSEKNSETNPILYLSLFVLEPEFQCLV